MRLSLLFALPFMGIVSPVFADQIQTVQRLLNELGYNAGVPDGIIGRKTTKAITSFYIDNDRTFDGVIDDNETADLTTMSGGFYGECTDINVDSQPINHTSAIPPYLPQYETVVTQIPAYVVGTFGRVANPEYFENVHPWVLAVSDLNNDGITDIYVGYAETGVPPLIYLGTASGKFNPLENPVDDFRRHVNLGTFSDLNADGYDDFIGFTSADHVEHFAKQGYKGIAPGESDFVLINDGGTAFLPLAVPEARKNDINHGGVIADINNDGFMDIIPLSENDGDATYPLINIAGTSFELSRYPLPKVVSEHWIEYGATSDLDGDGFDDLVISLELPTWSRKPNFNLVSHVKSHKPLLVIYGDGDFDFSNNRTLRIGKYWFTADALHDYAQPRRDFNGKQEKAETISFGTSAISIADLNNDGRPDIIEGQYMQAPYWETSGFQVYLNRGNCFQLATQQLFPDQTANRVTALEATTKFTKQFDFADLNQDGLVDVLHQALAIYDRQKDIGHANYPYIFIADRSGEYLPLTYDETRQFRNVSKMLSGDFNGDGLTDLVGTRLDDGQAEIVTLLAKPIDEILLQKRSANTKKLRLKWTVSMHDDDYKEFLEAEDTIYINSASEIIDIEGIDHTDEGVSGRDTLEYSVTNEMLKIKGVIVLFGNERLYVNFSAPLDAKQVSRTFGPQDKLILTWEFE